MDVSLNSRVSSRVKDLSGPNVLDGRSLSDQVGGKISYHFNIYDDTIISPHM